MTLSLVTFTVSDLASGRSLGQAVLCLDVTYAAVQWGDGELQRLYAHPKTWKEMKAQIALGVNAGPIDKDSPLVKFLIGTRSDFVLQYVSQEPIACPQPADAVNVLDGRLRQLIAA